jgi:hypothetical protein
MKDSVGKWFKKGAKDLNVIPPHEAWENVEKTIEDWPEHWYKSNFSELETPADKKSWNELSSYLAIRRNARIGRRNFVLRTASVVAALLLLPLWLTNVVPNLLFTTNPEAESIEFNQSLISETNAPIQGQTNKVYEPYIASNSNKTIAEGNSNDRSTLNQTVAPTRVKVVQTEVLSEHSSLVELSSMITRILHQLPVDNENLSLATTYPISDDIDIFDTPLESNNTSDRNWSIGPMAIWGSSSLLNPLSFRQDVITSNSFNISYGITASKTFNRNQITADLLFNDSKSQLVALNTEELSTQLNGTTLALQYERIAPILKNAQKLQPELNFGVGAFTSYFTKATVSSTTNNSLFSEFTYKRVDFGGVLSLGTSIQIHKRLRFGIGARVHSGAINLFEGREKVPSNLFRTRSMVTGVQTKLIYTF